MGRYKDVSQSWLVGCDGRPGSFPTMHVLCRLCSRLPNDLLTTWHDFLTLYPRLLFIPDHSRSFWTVQNNREQSGTHRPSSPTSQDLPRPIPVLSRLSYDFTRPLPTIKVGKGRLSGRLSVTGALGTCITTLTKIYCRTADSPRCPTISSRLCEIIINHGIRDLHQQYATAYCPFPFSLVFLIFFVLPRKQFSKCLWVRQLQLSQTA